MLGLTPASSAISLNADVKEYKKLSCRNSQRGRAMLRVCIASIQNVERSLLLLVVSASDIPLRTIKFFSVLFVSAYWSMLQAVTKQTFDGASPTVPSTLHGRR